MARKQKRLDSAINGTESEVLKTLLHISQSLHQYRDLNDLIEYIINQVTEVMFAETASVILYDERKNELAFRWSTDIPQRRKKLGEVRFPASKGIAGSVLKSERGELILDVAKDPRHYRKIDDATGFKTKSMIAVPLKTKGKAIGVLEILNKSEGVFGEKDLDFMTTLAPIVAMALDNARMYGELDSAYRELQLVDKGKDDLIKQTKNEVVFLRREVERQYRFDKIIGTSKRMMEVFALCEKVIDSDITVLIEGETGTGKELIARTIHYNGPRKNRPFVAQNCGDIPDTLLASELFGHKKGAYTGAFTDKKGLLEAAHGGTVFLDEVSEMSAMMQVSLLRVLQDGEIRPLGSELTKKVDIRVISATNKSLEEELREGRLREDLFYRLSVFTMRLPPLRERTGDIPVLANHLVRKFNKKTGKSIKGLSQEAMDCLLGYPFPGNVRELENEIERALAMAEDGKFIEVSNLSEKIRLKSITGYLGFQPQGSLKQMVVALEKSALSKTLAKYDGNKTKAARELGLSRYGLTKKIKRYGL